MAHAAQFEFCKYVKSLHLEFFQNSVVLDCGSLDINGSTRPLFNNCEYTGIDIGPGKGVDIVSKIHEFRKPPDTYDVVISTECFEHDMYYVQSLQNIVRVLRPGGLFVFSCATTGRPEHGTKRTSISDAPHLVNYDTWCNYYKNLTEEDIRHVLDIDETFSQYQFSTNTMYKDLYFWGLKRLND